MKKLIIVWLSMFIFGCASNNVVVKISTQKSPENGLLTVVTVNDLRSPRAAESTRQAAFGVPMGNVSFDPPEAQIVKNFMETELSQILREKAITTTQNYTCDVVEFGVSTNTTPLYWDVVGSIRLVLKHEGKEYNLSGTHTERTYVWPGESLIKKVVDESLRKISSELRTAM